MEAKQDQYMMEDEITLKELILKIGEFWREALKNWIIIIGASGLLAAIFLYRAFQEPVLYPAKLTFMVNEDEGGGMGGVSAILGQFGFGGGGRGKNNLDRILDLSKSRKIVKRAIFEKSTVDGKKDFIANHIIRLYDFHEAWEEDTTGLKDFVFINSNDSLFKRHENKAMLSVFGKIVGSEDNPGMFSTGYSEDTGIMKFECTTESEQLSIDLLNVLYEKISTFYVNKSIEKQEQTYRIVKEKSDSIKNLMTSVEYSLANFKDRNRGLFTAKDRLRELQLERDVQVMNKMYAESIKNMEIADFSLKNATPFVQLIDAPIAPITPQGESKIKAIIIGGFLGGFLSVFFVIGRKIYRDAMKE